MKLGIIVDSSCGLEKKDVEKRGWSFLPLFLSINEKEYADGIDINPKTYYKLIDTSMNVKTSATPPALIEKIISKASNEYDYVMVYPLSQELSSQKNNIEMLSKDFKNVHVLNSKAVGHTIIKNCEEIQEFAKKNNSIELVMEKAQELTDSQIGFAIPETMDWLVKGGRASKKAASLANMLKIIPIISFENGKLDKGGKGRVFKKTFLKAAFNLISKMGTKNIEYVIFSADNKNSKEIAKIITDKTGIDIEIYNFPPIIGNHIGKGALALISTKNKIV